MVKLHILDKERRKFLQIAFVVGVEKRCIQRRNCLIQIRLRLDLVERQHLLRSRSQAQERQSNRRQSHPQSQPKNLHRTPTPEIPRPPESTHPSPQMFLDLLPRASSFTRRENTAVPNPASRPIVLLVASL